MIRLRKDIVFRDPESRIREYCAVEVYKGYDDKHNVNNIISKEDIAAANNLYAMIDLHNNNESDKILHAANNDGFELKDIPNEDISNISASQWLILRQNIKWVLARLTAIEGIGLAKSTKILHLKRPKLLPILDKSIINFLLGVDLSKMTKDEQLTIAMQAIDKTREILIEQKPAFEELKLKTKDLQFPLTAVRIFHILSWTAQKWDIEHKLNAPFGIPSNSLLDLNGTVSKGVDNAENESLSSNNKSIVQGFLSELAERAKFGIQGEKPIAILAILKYIHENHVTGKTLFELLSEPHLFKIRTTYIDLAKCYSSNKISNPISSWSVITGKSRDLQHAIVGSKTGNVNLAMSKLSSDEIESLLVNYLKELEKFADDSDKKCIEVPFQQTNPPKESVDLPAGESISISTDLSQITKSITLNIPADVAYSTLKELDFNRFSKYKVKDVPGVMLAVYYPTDVFGEKHSEEISFNPLEQSVCEVKIKVEYQREKNGAQKKLPHVLSQRPPAGEVLLRYSVQNWIQKLTFLEYGYKAGHECKPKSHLSI
jgi:hypothetical protein